jgi:hypothetical protein
MLKWFILTVLVSTSHSKKSSMLQNCGYLFSISKALKNGFDLNNNGLMMSLKKRSVSVKFNRVVKTVK